MRISRIIVALPAFILGMALLSGPSHAQWYVSGNVGAVIVQDADITETGPGFSGTGEFEFDTGYGVNGAIGYEIPNVRLEAELSYRQADFDTLTVDTFTVAGLTFVGLGTANVEGDASSIGLMGNVWYDFDIGGGWLPFVGVGIGLARVNADIESVGGASVDLNDDDTAFAYQAGAGIGYQISDNAVATLGYRFFGTSDLEFESGGVTDEVEFRSHNFEVGIRFSF